VHYDRDIPGSHRAFRILGCRVNATVLSTKRKKRSGGGLVIETRIALDRISGRRFWAIAEALKCIFGFQRIACFIRSAQSRAFPLTLSNSFVDQTAVLSKSTVPSFGEVYSAGEQNDHGFVAISAPVLETTLHWSSCDLKPVVGLFRRSVWQGNKSWNCALWNDVGDRRGSG